jgi:NAD(P)-dependent dehydrogenase (short-subunit alcohol dehydrogenase family)
MTTSLVTGANKGLGFETARQLIAAGHHVWIGARDAEKVADYALEWALEHAAVPSGAVSRV